MAFVVVGVFLAVVGLGDLLRAVRDDASPRRLAAIVGVGATLLGVGVVALDVSAWPGLALWLALVAAYGAWVLGSSRALVGGPGAARARLVAAGGLVLGLTVGFLGAEVATAPGWPAWLDDTAVGRWPVQDVVVATGAVLAQLASANIAVRLLLDSVGVPATTNEKQLKGGRVLGPMERLFILGLGAIGQVTAAAIVVAAKGLLRFPELQRAVRVGAGEELVVTVEGGDGPEDLPGPSDVTEYFLIGSFGSWLLALAGVALIYLA